MSRLIDKLWRLWLKDKSQVIKDLAKKYPPATRLLTDDGLLHVIGYSEDGCLLVSLVNPIAHYAQARKESFHWSPECCVICGQHRHPDPHHHEEGADGNLLKPG